MTSCTRRANWQRVSRRQRCPICGRPDWCLVTGPAGSPEAVICARVESNKRVGAKGAGWLHRLRDHHQGRSARLHKRHVTIGTADEPALDFKKMAAACEATLSPYRLALLVVELGVTAHALSGLQIGWSQQHRAFTFPMHDANGHARGIRLRGIDGRKWAVTGSRQGLFLPRPFPRGDSLVVCEGPTDTAAMRMLGFEAVGRPSCQGGVELLVDLVQQHPFHEVVIIADRDAPGQRGARDLATRVVGYVPDGVRIVTPPTKDAREWVRSGANRSDVLDAIEAAPLVTLAYNRRDSR